MNKKIILIQISLFIVFILSWELLSYFNIIDSFIFSSPSKIINTLLNTDNLFNHIFYTFKEIIVSVSISMILGLLIALLLYLFNTLKLILDPFILLFNSLPKVSLGPLLIIWIGANFKSIVVMSLLISIVVTFTTIYNGFINVDKDCIKLFKVYKSSKYNIITKLILPSSIPSIISALKLNISLTFIGVIMGEFLSCKYGIGYLILYGSQIFNLSLVMSGIVLLLLLSFIFYIICVLLEKK